MKFRLLFLVLSVFFITSKAQETISTGENNNETEIQTALDSLQVVSNKVETYIYEEIKFTGGETVPLQAEYANKPNFIWCNEIEREEGPITHLVDGDVTTYFHSCWTSTVESVHWLQVNLEEPLSRFTFSYHTRQEVQNDFPTAIEVMGSNDGLTFTSIQKFSERLPQMGNMNWDSELVIAEQPYSFLRFVVTAPRIYFHMAEFSISTETFIPNEYLPYIKYLKELRELNEQAKALYNNSDGKGVDEIIAITNKLNAFYAIRENIIKHNAIAYGLEENFAWVINDNQLTIYGSGEIPHYDDSHNQPWYDYKDNINEIIVSDGITKIGRRAFYGMNYLTNVFLGKELIKIDYYAFNANNLNIEMKATNPPIVYDNNGFGGCDRMIVRVPEGCRELYKSADFWKDFLIIDGDGVRVNVVLTEAGTLGDKILEQVEYFSEVNSLKISGTINSNDIQTIKNRLNNLVDIDLTDVKNHYLENEIFKGKYHLQKAKLPGELYEVPNQAFSGCTMLQEIVLPTSIYTIGSESFYNCKSLRNVTLPKGLAWLGEYSFYYCDKLQSIEIPKSVSKIERSAFYSNNQLKKIILNEGLKEIGDFAFSNCAIDTLIFPNSLEKIGNESFSSNQSLKKVIFNEGLKEIGDGAFAYSNITDITLPSTLVRAKGQPFYKSERLRKITCLSVEPPLIDEKFNSNYEGWELYVPEISLNVYKQANIWADFPIIEPINFLPENITIRGNHKLTLPTSIPSDYNPNVSLLYDENNGYHGNLIVNGNSTLNIATFSKNWDYDAGKCNTLINKANMRAEQVKIKMNIPTKNWVFFSLPFDTKLSEIVTPDGYTTNFVIHHYDGEKRALGETNSTWVKLNNNDILKAHEGYIIQADCYENSNRYIYECTLIFSANNNANKNNIFLNDNAIITLETHQSNQIHNQGWNLIGNPYPCNYDIRYMNFTAPITTWKDNTYIAYSPIDDPYILTPGEAFFVQCPAENPNVIFDKEGRQNDYTYRTIDKQIKNITNRKVLNLTISNDVHSDRTRIVFNENASMKYEQDKDANKFISNNDSVPQIYTTNEGINYAINERPFNEGIVEISIRTNINGEYKISLAPIPNNDNVYLFDKKTGIKMLLSNEEYTFTAQTDDAPNRFTLYYDSLGITNIEETPTTKTQETDIYNIYGIKMNPPLQKGIYIQNGKKIIIK